MNEKKHLVPSCRFPEYEGSMEWKVALVKDVCFIGTGKSNSQDQDESGKYPFFIRSENPVKSKRYLYDCEAVITIGDGKIGKVFHYVNGKFDLHQRCYRMTDFNGVNGKFFYYFFSSHFYDRAMRMTAKATVDSVRLEMISEMPIYFPSISEQEKIADCLSSIDSCIASINEKIEQLKAYKKGLMQKLFPQNGQTIPEYRFPEFRGSDEWKNRKMGDVTIVVNRRNKSNRSLPIYSISNTDGFVPQSEQFDGLDSKSRGYDISLYKVVGRNTFAYNPARINIGSFGYSGNLKEVLISSLYVCFKTTDEIDDEFMICFLNTAHFRQAVESNVEGGIRSYLFYENFSRINIIFPTIQEQRRISSVIKSIDKLLSSNQHKVSLLEEQKKGLMQNLFPSTNK